MIDLCADIGYKSINHYGEQLCGDHIEIVSPDDNSAVVVLSDGLGSGVKANILSRIKPPRLPLSASAHMCPKDFFRGTQAPIMQRLSERSFFEAPCIQICANFGGECALSGN